MDVGPALAALSSPLHARVCFELPAMTAAELEATATIMLRGIFAVPPAAG